MSGLSSMVLVNFSFIVLKFLLEQLKDRTFWAAILSPASLDQVLKLEAPVKNSYCG